MRIEIDHGRHETGALPDHCGERRSKGTHVENRNKHKVQDRVEDRGGRDEHERPLGIAHPAQDGGDDVISVDKDQAGDAGHHVIHCKCIGFRRCVEPV